MRQKLEVYVDRAGGWRWRFRSNGRIMADSSESYSSKRNCIRAWERFQGYAACKCEVVEVRK